MGTHLVTGATGVIGSATVQELEKREQRVIPVVRSATSPEAIAADLSLLGDVERIAAEIAARHDSLDGLILNAGLALSDRQMTPEGFETVFAVNHLGAFLLAHRLLPLLANAPRGRIVLTGSSDHMSVKQVSITEAADGADYSYTGTYARSKAIAMAAMMEMAHRLTPDDWDPEAPPEDQPQFVRVNVADPGWTRTGLTRHAPLPIRLLVTFGRPLQNRPKHSARVLADLATTTEETGRYIGIRGPLTASVLLRDGEFRRKAYDDTVNLLVGRGFATADDFLPASYP